MKFALIEKNKQKGMSLIESIISSGLILFVLSSSFVIINSNIVTSATSEKKVALTEQLDKRIDNYILTGIFDTTPTNGANFSQVKASDSDLARFVGEDKDFDIAVSKEVIKYNE